MQAQDFSETYFRLKVLLRAEVSTIFNHLTQPNGLCSWFLGSVEYRNSAGEGINMPREGAKYIWKWQKDYQTSGKVKSIEPDSTFRFTFGDDFEVQFSLEKSEHGVLLLLEQWNSNPRPENAFSFLNCCVCWTFFLSNLKSVLESGVDLRENAVFDESFVNQ